MKRILSLLMVVILGVFVFLMIDLVQNKKFESDFKSKIKIREELIEKVQSREVRVDEEGNVILNEKYSDIAVNDYVHMFVCNDEEKVISFLYKAGFPDEEEYIFYSSDGSELIEKYVNKSLYSYIEKIEENWYLVQYN